MFLADVDFAVCYIAEFLNKCGTEYKTLLQNRSSGLETVVVPTSEQRPISSSSVAHGGDAASSKSVNISDGVDSAQYTRAVLSCCDRVNCSCVSPLTEKYSISANLRQG